MATDQTYFDPTTERRIDGQDALKAIIAPFAGQISIERPEMINHAFSASVTFYPDVQPD